MLKVLACLSGSYCVHMCGMCSIMSKRCQTLLLQIYLHFPEVIQHIHLPEATLSGEGAADGSTCKVTAAVYDTSGHELPVYSTWEINTLIVSVFVHVQLDVLVHRLITLLADTGDSKSAENRASDASLACRKLAVSHPVLLLRFTTQAFSIHKKEKKIWNTNPWGFLRELKVSWVAKKNNK